MFHSLTGLNCPGCGTTRALHQLACGHPLTALHLNALTVLGLPILGFWLLQSDRPALKPIWFWGIIGGIVAFGIIRNLPIFPFTFLNP